MRTRSGRIAAGMVLASLMVGCAELVRGPSLEPAHPDCQFPPDTALAFSGEATLEDAGLGGSAEDAVGTLYVTAEPIRIPQMDSNDLIRRFCIIYPETESGLAQVSGLAPDDWLPPD